MAGFTMQVQSAIFPFVCTLTSRQPLCCLRLEAIRSGLARVPVKLRRGSLIPHSPFGGGMRAN